MPGKLVHYELDPANPPALTEEQIARLKALAVMPDEDIDFSDIPPLTDEFFKNGLRGVFQNPPIRLDSRVVPGADWRERLADDGGQPRFARPHRRREEEGIAQEGRLTSALHSARRVAKPVRLWREAQR
jgi:hypothetical protein